MRRALAIVVAFLLTLVITGQARAQRAEITPGVDVDTVEIGERITYSQQVMVHDGLSPSDPRPGPIPGFSLQGGVQSAPVHMRMSVNGSIDDVNGLMTSWTLRADKIGTFTLGPSQITIGATKRTAAKAVRVKVVERGKGSPRPRGRTGSTDPFGTNPLDPFKSLFDFDDGRSQPEPPPPNADPKLALEAPRSPVAFLHATLDKTSVVVGEQVTLTVYLYEDPEARQGDPRDVHEANANDFVKRSLVEDETRAVRAGTAMVGGKPWNVKLVRKNALFPLKTGHLEIEPMSLTLPQARVGLRASETLYVDVIEPPIAGRPAGYAIGDVGDMSLQATVTTRAIPRDGAIGVTVELRGTGNLPSALAVPSVPGVEWLEPNTRDKLAAQQNDRFGGTRTFSYVVRIHKEGAVDLGEIPLPHFDPSKRAYRVARATIGIVNVATGPDPDAGSDQPELVLVGLPKARNALERPRTQSFLTERPAYWVALFGSPLACALALGAHGLVGRYRGRRALATPSLDQTAKNRRAEAEAACGKQDGKAAMGAIARATEAEVLARTGVNLRGAPGDTLKAELEDAGVVTEAAESVIAIVRACEDARFSPDGITVEHARETWSKAVGVIDGLRAIRIPGGGSKPS